MEVASRMTEVPFLNGRIGMKDSRRTHQRIVQTQDKTETMKSNCSESSTKPNTNTNNSRTPVKPNNTHKPPFMPAKDDTKPVLQDPILRSDPIETEEAVLRLPPFSIPTSNSQPQME